MPEPSASPSPIKILVISSQVIVGRVGLSVIAPAYALLGLDGYYLPTVLLSSRPGLGSVVRHATPASVIDDMLDALTRDGRLDDFHGVLTGYFSSVDQIAVVVRHLRALRQRKSDLPVLVDPVIGDTSTGLFVDEAIADAIRDLLVPVASAITPNRFELSWLTNSIFETPVDVDTAARTLKPDIVIITSANSGAKSGANTGANSGIDQIETRYVGRNDALSWTGERMPSVPNGTGDLFAGLATAAFARGSAPDQAMIYAAAALEGVCRQSQGKPWLELDAVSGARLEPDLGPDFDRNLSPDMNPDWVAGVDGCRDGWAVTFWDLSGSMPPRFRRIATFGEVLDAPEAPRIVAVDMPIGLPARVGPGGRGPEPVARKHLGGRKSSVFSIPSRQAVYAPDYRAACTIALATSNPPRKISKQGFMLFPKIREIDAAMTADLCSRVYEVHPELAFWRLNDGAAMRTPKKIKSRLNPDGLAERRALLEARGFKPEFFELPLPRGVARDDFVDACACALIAVRLAEGTATPFPDNPDVDERGLTIAIWA